MCGVRLDLLSAHPDYLLAAPRAHTNVNDDEYRDALTRFDESPAVAAERAYDAKVSQVASNKLCIQHTCIQVHIQQIMHHVNESRMHVHARVNASSQFCCVRDSSNTTSSITNSGRARLYFPADCGYGVNIRGPIKRTHRSRLTSPKGLLTFPLTFCIYSVAILLAHF